MKNLAQGTLTAQLQDLLRDGVFLTVNLRGIIASVEYNRTPIGITLLPVTETPKN